MMKNAGGRCISPMAVEEMAAGRLDWEQLPTAEAFDNPRDFVKHHAAAILDDVARWREEQRTKP